MPFILKKILFSQIAYCEFVFSFLNGNWTEEHSLNKGRADHSMVGSSKTLYVFGGSGTVSSGESMTVQNNDQNPEWNVFSWIVRVLKILL
jgi:hypothetical protein